MTVMREFDSRIAKAISVIGYPGILGSIALLAICIKASSEVLEGLGWFALTEGIGVVPPLLLILIDWSRHRIEGLDIVVKQQRTRYYIATASSTVAAILVIVILKAPREIVAFVLAALLVVPIGAGINHFWKISVHTGIATLSVVGLILTFGNRALPLLSVPVLVGWSRVVLGHHSIGQVILAALIVTTMCFLVYIYFGLL
jgi:membrane-associated phospholipid phosphatase